MDILDSKTLKQTAQARLAAASYDHRKLMLLHTGAALAVSFLITLLNFILTRQIDTTSGLSGLQTRAVLETVQTVLQYGGSLAMPFWEIGILFTALRWARTEPAAPASLFEGFRRFGPVLRWMLLKMIAGFAIAIACAYISSGIYMMTPFAQPLMEILLPMLESTTLLSQELVMDEATLAAVTEAMTPVLIIFGILFCIVCIPLLYRLRMSGFVLMDEERPGALQSILKSWKMTRGNVLKLVRLDLHFWWFYGLQVLIAVISYADALLPAMGISLPVSKDLTFFGFYLISMLCQLALYWYAASHVQTTYALAYEALLQKPEVPTVQPIPTNQPWDY